MLIGDLDSKIAQYGVSRQSLQKARSHANDRANGRAYGSYTDEEKADMLTGDLDSKIAQYGVSRYSLRSARWNANARAKGKV